MPTPIPKSLHIIDTTGPGGAETLFIEIASSLIQSGGNVLALVRGPGWVETSLKKKNIPHCVRDNKGAFNIGYLCFLCSLIRREEIRVIHTHLFGSAVYGALAGLLTTTPVIATFHGLVDIKPDERLTKLKLNIVSRGAQIVAVSAAIKNMLTSEHKLNTEAVVLIPNGINCEQIEIAENLALRNQFNLSHDAQIIGALGNVRPAKDYRTAIKAIAELIAQGHNPHLMIAGDPKESLVTPLKQLSAQLGTENHIHFLGFIEDTNEFLSGVDIFISSSISEGQPLSVFQAMSQSLPIVATRSGVESILTDGETAWLAPTQDSVALAGAISKAINDPEEQIRRGANARKYVTKNHSKETMLNAYMDLYQKFRPQ